MPYVLLWKEGENVPFLEKKKNWEYLKKDCHLQNHCLKQLLIGVSGSSLQEVQADIKHLLKLVTIWMSTETL